MKFLISNVVLASLLSWGTFVTGQVNSYDYIIVGAGPPGIVAADKLTEAGLSVLLIERGPPSTGQWGGSMKPTWLDHTNLTRFDVPGLANEIYVSGGSTGVFCPDVGQPAGCQLGGGASINAGLWWSPPDADWDDLFPDTWKSTDVVAATQRVFERLPGTYIPARDGQLVLQQGADVVATGLANAGWTNLTNGPNSMPNAKNFTFGKTTYMTIDGERGGPLATYLATANARPNFEMWLNTTVNRVVRTGGQVIALELEAFGENGHSGFVNVTATGKVIISAGVFGTARILYRSGIGPTDQLQIVQSSTDGPTMISEDEWIDLPVGHGLQDHTNTVMTVTNPEMTSFYDYNAAYTDPIQSDVDLYLNDRSGILTEVAPNIGPMFWMSIPGSDGLQREFQITCYASASLQMQLAVGMGRGTTSRGTLAIASDLSIDVGTLPYVQNDGDVSAIITALTIIVNNLTSTIPDLTFLTPNLSDQTIEEFVNSDPVTASRGANHWVGTTKIGNDSGLEGGSSVVDLDGKVYGMDNLFVLDAGLVPGIVGQNPSALLCIMAENMVARWLS